MGCNWDALGLPLGVFRGTFGRLHLFVCPVPPLPLLSKQMCLKYRACAQDLFYQSLPSNLASRRCVFPTGQDGKSFTNTLKFKFCNEDQGDLQIEKSLRQFGGCSSCKLLPRGVRVAYPPGPTPFRKYLVS